MTQVVLWEEVWDAINDAFTLLASQVLAAAPDKRWLADHFETEHWALSGTASFMPRDDPAADEDLVVSIQAHRSGATLTWSSDILAGGEIVSDGRQREVAIGTALVHWAPEALAATLAWLRAETPDIIAYLSDQKPFPSEGPEG